MIDVQSAVLAELIGKLAAVPDFGASVTEDFVLRVIDSDDDTLPDDIIVIQPGDTEELERVGTGGVRERVTLNLTLLTRRRQFGPVLRAGRLAVKAALAGVKGSLATQGVTQFAVLPEQSVPAREGSRWAARVMPVQISYQQPLK